MTKLIRLKWQRDSANPILPPTPDSPHESSRCMNPFAVRVDDEYRLYYSGGDTAGHQRICLATMPVAAPDKLTRRGMVLDLGQAGSFDANWCVLPCVHQFGTKWHMYYSGNEGTNLGLQSFPWDRLSHQLRRHPLSEIFNRANNHRRPDRRIPRQQGHRRRRLNIRRRPTGRHHPLSHVLHPSRRQKGSRFRIDQEKHCAVCHSTDGIHWTDHRLVLRPRRDVTCEDIAVAAPFVWRDGDLYRMLYCGIGTRWGYYSISQAVSEDGYTWACGEGDENLTLLPDSDSSWESQMVEYPCLLTEGNQLRLFYCGNGYGATGIGTALTTS